jgi:hypothetical protein
MRWDGRVEFMCDITSAYKTLVGQLKVKDHLVDVDVDDWMILKWTFRKK